MNVDGLRKKALEDLERAADRAALEGWRAKYLGRKSELATFLRGLSGLSMEERRTLGAKANTLRRELESRYRAAREDVSRAPRHEARFDITRPGKKFARGHLHPLTITLRRMIGIFSAMGFEVVEGPNIETEHYNFDALNIPPWHPARDLWDTFWLKTANPKSEIRPERIEGRNSRLLLRTHTSPVQIRYMETHRPPFRIIAPGSVFRHEATDARHEMEFYQVEGLMVGADVSLANFKAVMAHALKEFFGQKTELKLRASYFPFTEPSFEVLMSCAICGGRGVAKGKRCYVCGGEKWLEMGGAGMVHPQVFRNVGYDPETVQGFAFGIGAERFAMVKYKIDDIRLFRSGDLRFINQF
jgi:phenylalanyl-tRNA synthetase alpha chain